MYRLNFRFLNEYGDLLIKGMGGTLLLCICSLILSFVLGVVMALMRRSHNKVLRTIGTAWVEFLRNTPFLVQLFFFYYGLPVLGIPTDPMLTSIIALGINSSAPNCEVVRSGLMAVKKGYYECAAALGFTPFQTFRYVVMPTALRVAFKPLTSNFINLVLTSSVAFAVTAQETMYAAKTISSRTSRPFEVYILIIACYCAITFFLSFISKLVDRKISITL